MPDNHNDKNKINQDDKTKPGQQRSPQKQNEGQTRDPSKSGQPNKDLEDQITQKDPRRP
jgi:hypothetical protein